MNTENITLTEDQAEAVQEFMDLLAGGHQVRYRLLGYAGTGKTVTAAVLASLLQNTHNIYMLAPTNQAVLELQKKLSGINAKYMTLHRAFGFRMVLNAEQGEEELKGGYNPALESRPGKPNLLIIDEISMVSEDFLPVLEHIDDHMILIGDPAQLPPVGESRSSLIDDLEVDGEYELTQVLRQEDGSSVLEMATQIREGYMGAFRMVEGDDIIRGMATDQMASLFCPQDPYAARILTWTNDTRRIFNDRIRASLGLEGLPEFGEYQIVMKPVFAAYDFERSNQADWDKLYDLKSAATKAYKSGDPYAGRKYSQMKRYEEWLLEQPSEKTLVQIDPVDQIAYWAECARLREIAQKAYKNDSDDSRRLWAEYKEFQATKENFQLHTSSLLRIVKDAEDAIFQPDVDAFPAPLDIFDLDIPCAVADVELHHSGQVIRQFHVQTDETREILDGLKRKVGRLAGKIRKERKGLDKMSRSHRDLTRELRDLWKSYYLVERAFGDVDHAYASTVHKAQGSGFRNVMVHREIQNAPHKKAMLYTAVTRVQETLIIL